MQNCGVRQLVLCLGLAQPCALSTGRVNRSQALSGQFVGHAGR